MTENARIFVAGAFDSFAEKSGVSDRLLVGIVDEMERGLVGAKLGAGVFKKRVAREGSGRSGGFRTVVVFKRGALAVFVMGYAKNDKPDLSPTELKALKELARDILALSDPDLTKATAAKALREIHRDGWQTQE